MLREDILIRMQRAGQALNVENPIYLKADGLSQLPRKLDSAPKPIKLRTFSVEQSYGARNEFVMMYEEYKKSMNLETSRIQVGGSSRVCDPEIYYALHCLALSAIHCVPERAQAAADLFKAIMTTPCTVLTSKIVYERLEQYKTKDYYTNQFKSALQICIFNQDPMFYCWMTLASDHSYYQHASKAGMVLIREHGFENPQQLKKYLNTIYAEAKEDKEFLKRLYKPLCNKWMTAMIYALKDSNPDVFKTTDSDGFL